jgi:hypothetical protein
VIIITAVVLIFKWCALALLTKTGKAAHIITPMIITGGEKVGFLFPVAVCKS